MLYHRFSKTRALAKFCLIVLSFLNAPTSAEPFLEFEFDPYYSNAGHYISFTEAPIPVIEEPDEAALFDRMLDSTLTLPRFMLIEASVNPLPLLGVYTRKHHPGAYQDAQLRGDLNIVQALTEGFEEPYALSLFFGSIVRFAKPGEKGKIKNRGYSGYLISYGDRHIINNEMVDDKWYEFEWKIKGDQDFEDKTLSWSVRAGLKYHNHIDITDVVYFAYRRNHFDNNSNSLSFISNSDIEYKIEFKKDGFSLAQQELFINKKWPTFTSAKSAFSLGIGFIKEKAKYSGQLANKTDDFRVIIRPNFQF